MVVVVCERKEDAPGCIRVSIHALGALRTVPQPVDRDVILVSRCTNPRLVALCSLRDGVGRLAVATPFRSVVLRDVNDPSLACQGLYDLGYRAAS